MKSTLTPRASQQMAALQLMIVNGRKSGRDRDVIDGLKALYADAIRATTAYRGQYDEQRISEVYDWAVQAGEIHYAS